jgi:hypothetical protein
MGKQLSTGEGGMAITNDDKLAFELNRRIIFGESPEVLSSNYRMTEFQAAVGVEQLRKVPRYLKIYKQGKKILDDAVSGCSWLDIRKEIPGSDVAPYYWSCLFRGERKGIEMGILKAASRQLSGNFGFGFIQRPGYMYEIFRKPNAYGNKGCPYNCHLYTGHVNWKVGMCPTAEDVIPRLVTAHNMNLNLEYYRKQAKKIKEVIRLAESGQVKPLEYDETDKKILEVVKVEGPLEPMEVVAIFDKKGWGHFDEHSMLAIMENLRERFPFKLSHAGPRKFAYHDLSRNQDG